MGDSRKLIGCEELDLDKYAHAQMLSLLRIPSLGGLAADEDVISKSTRPPLLEFLIADKDRVSVFMASTEYSPRPASAATRRAQFTLAAVVAANTARANANGAHVLTPRARAAAGVSAGRFYLALHATEERKEEQEGEKVQTASSAVEVASAATETVPRHRIDAPFSASRHSGLCPSARGSPTRVPDMEDVNSYDVGGADEALGQRFLGGMQQALVQEPLDSSKDVALMALLGETGPGRAAAAANASCPAHMASVAEPRTSAGAGSFAFGVQPPQVAFIGPTPMTSFILQYAIEILKQRIEENAELLRLAELQTPFLLDTQFLQRCACH